MSTRVDFDGNTETAHGDGPFNPNLGGSQAFEGASVPNLGGMNGRGSFFGGTANPTLAIDPYGMNADNVDTGKSIVKRILTGRENYITWKLAMEIALSGKSQLGFVRGQYAKPEDPFLAIKWQKCNDIIMSWIISSVSESIGEQVMRAKDVVTAWNALQVRYGGTNLARKSVLMAQVSSCSQGDSEVAAYYDRLSRLWQELDAVKKSRSMCPDCCRESDEEVQEDRVVKFLIGLNDSFAVVRSNIFAMAQVPNIDRVYDMVTQEETQRNVKKSLPAESSAMYSANRNQDPRFSGRGRGGRGRGARIICSHCQMPGHSKENCYKLIGYPSGWKSRDINRPELGMFNANKCDVISGSTFDVAGSQFTNEQVSQLNKMNEQVSQLNKMLESFKVGAMNQSSVQMAGTIHMYAVLLDEKCWLIDSGASCHFTYNVELLTNVCKLENACSVRLPNGESLDVHYSGTCVLNSKLVLRDVLWVPDFKVNLISVHKIVSDSNCSVKFNKESCIIQDQSQGILLETGEPKDGLFSTRQSCNVQASNVSTSVTDLEVWHERLGHASTETVHRILKGQNNSVKHSSKYYHQLDCMICPLAKQTRLPFSLSTTVTNECFDIVHGDVWGPFNEETMSGCKYFLTLVDDYSRVTWTFLMKSKAETAEMVINFFKMVYTQFNSKIKCLRTDNGGEFICNQLENYLKSVGCIHQTTCPYTPQQNGVAERKHRHLLEMGRALMLRAQLPKIFWGDSILTATHIINRLPTEVLQGKSPWEMLFQQPASVQHLKVFGCLCFVSTLPHERDKFDPRAAPGIFLGYPNGKKGYKVMILDTREVVYSRNVHFRENTFPFKNSEPKVSDISSGPILPQFIDSNLQFPSDSELSDNEEIMNIAPAEDFVEDFTEISGNEITDEQEIMNDNGDQLRRSTRVRQPPAWRKDFVCNTKVTSPYPITEFVSYSKCSELHRNFALSISAIREPRSYVQASKDEKWLTAMQNEISALEQNQTWVISDLPSGKTLVDCKWVFKVKYHSDGSIERYKARLVARGFTQIEGLDYQETFAPVAKMTTVRCVLSIAAAREWPLFQLDVNNAFLHGVLDEEVYMQLPPGFYEEEKKNRKVCKLVKSLYGLKQASRQWFAQFSSAVIEYGFTQSMNDHSLFTLDNGVDYIVLLVYVDDVVLTGTSTTLMAEIKKFINDRFKIKDLGILKFFLGLEVARSSDGIFLNQRKYALELLEESGFLDCKPAKSPIEIDHKLGSSTAPVITDVLQYRRLVGKLVYLTISRPDLAYSVHILSQFVQAPTEDHMRAAHRVLRYIKAAPAQGILYPAKSDLKLAAFCDADWAACPLTRRSISGYCVTLGSSLISWKAKKQTVVARSSAESEYRSMAAVCCELVWLVRLLADLRVHIDLPIPLLCDNKAAIHIARNPVFHERTKHVEIDCHIVRSHVTAKFIEPVHTSTTEQPADFLTKALSSDQLSYLCSKLGVSNFLHSQLEGGYKSDDRRSIGRADRNEDE